MAGTQPNTDRKRRMVTVTLGPKTRARLDALAKREGSSRGVIIDRLVEEEWAIEKSEKRT